MNRRDFLLVTAATALSPRLSVAQTNLDLIAEPVGVQILPDGNPETQLLGFNGGSPGPVLRARQGDLFDIRFLNRIGQGSAVHWHGLRSDNAMDGVPGLTQEVVEDGTEFAYRFRAPDAGTFWYHSHNRSWEQVAIRGGIRPRTGAALAIPPPMRHVEFRLETLDAKPLK